MIIDQHITDEYAIYNGDCVEVWRDLPDNSIDFTVYSPPFCNLYIYSDSCRDMGNAANNDEFFKHYAFLLAEIYRTTTPGRLTSVHCKDLPKYRGRDGEAGLTDFPGDIVRAHEAAGFTFHSRVTVWKGNDLLDSPAARFKSGPSLASQTSPAPSPAIQSSQSRDRAARA